MAIVSYTPDPKRQRGLSAHEKRQQDALIPEQIEANALGGAGCDVRGGWCGAGDPG